MKTTTLAHLDTEQAYPERVRILQGEHSTTFQFQPGDGTRYVATVTDLSPAECRLHGCSEGSKMVAIMRGSNSFAAACFRDAPMSYYLAEKFRLREYEADAWERLLGFIFTGDGACFAAPWKG